MLVQQVVLGTEPLLSPDIRCIPQSLFTFFLFAQGRSLYLDLIKLARLANKLRGSSCFCLCRWDNMCILLFFFYMGLGVQNQVFILTGNYFTARAISPTCNFVFLRQGLDVQPWITWHSLCGPGSLWTHGNPPGLAFLVAGIKDLSCYVWLGKWALIITYDEQKLPSWAVTHNTNNFPFWNSVAWTTLLISS